MTTLNILRGHGLLGIDTSLFIYHFENSTNFAGASRLVLERIQQGDASGVTSTLTLTEVQTGPLRHGRSTLANRYETLIKSIPNFEIRNVTVSVARTAAQLRAHYGLRTPDAVQIATALDSSASAFITNDKRLKRVKEIEVILLGELT